MPDLDDGFDEAFKGFGEDEGTPPVTPPADPPKEEPKKNEQPTDGAEDEKKPEGGEAPKEETPPPAGDEKKPEENGEKPKAPETPPAPPEEPKPLTEDSIRNIIKDIRTEERTSTQALDETTNEVIEAYYPDGLSNVLVDQNSGKELRTPQDVVDASGGEMSIEQATQWLMNEQFKLDKSIEKIKSDAKTIAETTLKFKQDGVAVLERYDSVFKAYPHLQKKVWDQYKKLVKADESKNVILSAPDMMDFYDTVLEPYRLAVEYQTGQPGTAPTSQPPAAPEPPKPSAGDRLDETGDGGTGEVDDPNDFAQQVNKELAKGI